MDIIPQIIINSLVSGSLYALIALGLTLTFGAVRFFNFAHGSFAVLGAYLVFALTKRANIDDTVAIIIALIATGGIGVLIQKTVFGPLRKKKSTNLVMMIASLGVLTCFQAVFALVFSTQFQTLGDPYQPVAVYQIGTAHITQYQIFALAASVLVTVALVLFMNKTLMGKAIKALSDDEEVARIVGINTTRLVSVVFFISAFIAAIAGIAGGYDIGVDPSLGLGLFLKGVISTIVGGFGSVSGALFGAYLLGFVENFGIWQISSEWKDAIAFSLLIIFLLFRPQGIIKK